MMDFLLYIDPGSGSYLVQLIIAGVLGVGMFFKNIKLYIKSLFHKPSKKENDGPEA
jgi:hypothetical protein